MLMASNGVDTEIRLYDPVAIAHVGTIQAVHDRLSAVAAVPLPDGRVLICTGGSEGTVQLWDPLTCAVVGEPLISPDSRGYAMAVVPLTDGQTLIATSGGEGVVRLWDPVAGTPVGSPLTGPTGPVYEVVASGLTGRLGLFRRIGPKERSAIRDTLERLGLAEIAGSNIGQLSGGQQQRTFIARALVKSPDLLILDEPTVGVDSESVERFYRLLDQLHREENLTILLITHDIGAVTAVADRIACLNRRIRFCGDPQEFARRRGEILFEGNYGIASFPHRSRGKKSGFEGRPVPERRTVRFWHERNVGNDPEL